MIDQAKYHWYDLVDPPQESTSYEILEELTKHIKHLDIKICKLNYHHSIKSKQSSSLNYWDELIITKYRWFNSNYKTLAQFDGDTKTKSVEDNDTLILLKPQLLNESALNLARILDISKLIEHFLEKPSQRYKTMSIENIRIIEFSAIPQDDQQKRDCCVIFYGRSAQVDQLLKKINEDNDQSIIICGSVLKFRKNELRQLFVPFKVSRANQTILECNASCFELGQLKIKQNQKQIRFIKYWSLEAINLTFQSQVDLDQVKFIIILDEENTHVLNLYFDIVIIQTRRVSFKISFKIGNNCHKEAPVYAQKDSKNQRIDFYFKFRGPPQCYFSESLENDQYIEHHSKQWNQCNNFLFHGIDCISLQKIFEHNCAKLTINRALTEHKDFNSLCQGLEVHGLLNEYFPDLTIKDQFHYEEKTSMTEDKFNEYSIDNRLSREVQWQLMSCICSSNPLISNIDIQLFIQLGGLDQKKVGLAIKRLLKYVKKLQQKTITQLFMIQFIQDYCSKQQEEEDITSYSVRQVIVTPSQIMPNYFSEQKNILIFLSNVRIFQENKKYRKRVLAELLILVKFEDYTENQIQFSYLRPITELQDKIIQEGLFRKYIKNGIVVCGQTYCFLGFTRQNISKHECFFIEKDYLKLTSLSLYRGLCDKKLDLLNVINIKDVLEVNDEFFNHYIDDILIKEILPNETQQVKIDIVQSEPRSNYAKQILMSQGLASKKFFENMCSFIDQEPCSTIIIRMQQQYGVLNLRQEVDDNGIDIEFESDMAQQFSTFDALINQDVSSLPIIFDHNQEGLFQVVRYARYKPLKLKLYNILNIAQFGLNIYGKSILDHFHKLIDQLFRKFIVETKEIAKEQGFNQLQKESPQQMSESLSQPQQIQLQQQHIQQKQTQQEDQFQQKQHIDKDIQCLQEPKIIKGIHNSLNIDKQSIETFYLPIERGAQLMGVFDSNLQENEVFIQFSSTNTQSDTTIVESQVVLVFKKFSLHFDGVQKFFCVQNPTIKKFLAAKYHNVIVFSKKMPYQRFPFREGDSKQSFSVIWDDHLIPSKMPTLDDSYEQTYTSLLFKQENHVLSQSESDSMRVCESVSEYMDDAQQIYARRCTIILGDVFNLYMASQNYTELQLLYTKMMVVYLSEIRGKGPDDDRKLQCDDNFTVGQLSSTITSIELANLKQFWFGATQGMRDIFHQDSKKLMLQLLKNETFNFTYQIFQSLFQLNLEDYKT